MYLDFNWRRFSQGSCSKLLCYCAEYFSIKVSSIGFHFVWFLTLFIVLQLAGLAAVGQDCYGVFPLRGELLNVREATAKQLTENKEIGYIKQSLGLRQHKEYTNVKSEIWSFDDNDWSGVPYVSLIVLFLFYAYNSLYKAHGQLSTNIKF